MKYQSQNSETAIALKYFKGRKGTMLDIGANTGLFLSNSYDLIKQGWSCIAIEPSSAFKELKELHKNNKKKVQCHNVALGKTNGKLKFFESGAHVKGGTDKALVSTAVPEEMERWKDVDFEETEVDVIPFADFMMENGYDSLKIDYISLDVEGMEMEILEQINLKFWGVDLLCIEWNGKKELEKKYTAYCANHGLKEIHRNAENIIFAK